MLQNEFLVTEIGMETEVGKIAGLLKNTSEKRTPLQVNLDQFGQKLSILILVFCGILFGISILRGDNIGDAFLFAVALAVAAIPEALSSIVTIVLSFGTQKMAKEHAIIRKLQAVEGLGSVSVICSDKTGTLTQNKMTVEDYYVDEKSIPAGAVDLTDSSQSRLMISSILCNDATNADGIEIGDPTETALLNLASGLGMDPEEVRKKYPRESENPFDSDRKRMATKHMLNGIPTMIVKGAVDVLLDRTDLIQLGDEVYEITREDCARIEAQNRKYSEEGLRVLAFAYKVVSDEMELTLQDEDHLIFLGLVAMMDPPREESAAAVAECKRAGIRPIMITGDHKVTAAAIAKRIGILKEESEACEGSQIDRMSDEELKDFVDVPVKNFSSGMTTRLGFSIATIYTPDILIVDEILAVGDFAFQKKCEKRIGDMLNSGTTLLLVSHSTEQVRRICDRAVLINKGKMLIEDDVDTVCDLYTHL